LGQRRPKNKKIERQISPESGVSGLPDGVNLRKRGILQVDAMRMGGRRERIRRTEGCEESYGIMAKGKQVATLKAGKER